MLDVFDGISRAVKKNTFEWIHRKYYLHRDFGTLVCYTFWLYILQRQALVPGCTILVMGKYYADTYQSAQ